MKGIEKILRISADIPTSLLLSIVNFKMTQILETNGVIASKLIKLAV
jgi:hypothetical protein